MAATPPLDTWRKINKMSLQEGFAGVVATEGSVESLRGRMGESVHRKLAERIEYRNDHVDQSPS